LLRTESTGGGADADDGARRPPQPLVLVGATGTGKTLSYLLPLLTRWLRTGREAVLVVAPSQELAAQVARVGGQLLAAGAGGAAAATTTAASLGSVHLLIGGANAARQRAALAEVGAYRRLGDQREQDTEARLRRRQAGRKLARERRRAGAAPAAPLALAVGTPARLAKLLEDGSLDGGIFGALVLEEADQLSAGLLLVGAGGGEGEGGGDGPEPKKKGYADALTAVCSSLPAHARENAVLVSATLRRKPGALAALLPLLLLGERPAVLPPPVFIPPLTPAAAAAPAHSGTTTKHVLVLAPPQHRTAAARAALRALGVRAALVFSGERGGGGADAGGSRRLDDLAEKLGGGSAWVLHGGLPPAKRKAHLQAFARAAAAAAGVGGGQRCNGPNSPMPLFPATAGPLQPAPSSSTSTTTILVATDLAARGLDVSGLDAVVSLEPPRTAAIYAHRAGRVGRLGQGSGSGDGGGGNEEQRPSFVITVATAGQAPRVRRLCASLGVELIEGK
jgi:superfamily II DNA/RNA helicase